MEKMLMSFIISLTTFGALYLIWLFIVELFKAFGTVSIIGLIAFIGIWIVCYLIIDE